MEMLEGRQTKGFMTVELARAIEKRISFLTERDRRLVELSMRGTLTVRDAAQLLRMSPGTVSRRVKKLMTRLMDPLVVALVDRGLLLPEGYRDIGLAYYLRGMTVEEISRAARWSPYEVRRALAYMRGWSGGGRRVVMRQIKP
jgi:DNA-directed RNA polymerase specialized sigma24 family protein